MLAIEQAYLVALGLLGGTVLGLVVARLVVPHIVLSVQAAQPYPPADLVVQWPVVLGVLAAVAAVLGLVLAPVVRTLRRRDPGAGLRVGRTDEGHRGPARPRAVGAARRAGRADVRVRAARHRRPVPHDRRIRPRRGRRGRPGRRHPGAGEAGGSTAFAAVPSEAALGANAISWQQRLPRSLSDVSGEPESSVTSSVNTVEGTFRRPRLLYLGWDPGAWRRIRLVKARRRTTGRGRRAATWR